MTFCAAGFGSDCVDCLLWSRCAAIACDCISHGSTGCCGIDCGRGCVLYVTVYSTGEVPLESIYIEGIVRYWLCWAGVGTERAGGEGCSTNTYN